MRNILLVFIALYAFVQIYAAFVGWRRSLITSRGAFITMLAGSIAMLIGTLMDHPHSLTGVLFIAIGLYLISDSTFHIGSQRPTGIRYSHHITRALIGLIIVSGLLIA